MKAPTRLNRTTLRRLRAPIRVPMYDQAGLVPSLMHIGVGNFFRAHQAVYLDDLLAMTGEKEWAYCGVGLLGQDARMRDAMRAQDCLYTVLERGPEGDSARVVGSMVEYLHAVEDREQVLSRLASPRCRIVSLTITEGGYYRNDATGEFNDAHPDIVRDLAQPHEPECSFGYLLEALDRRRKAGLAPFTVFSCDNLQHNGTVARKMLTAFAELRDPELYRWVRDNVAFPNSMVDRIVPVTTDEHREALANEFGIVDLWPVGTEPFSQWVIEDYFPHGRPAWKRVGAQMTTDVEPYEKMKMRLLNGSHQAMCYIGLLLGLEHVHEAISDAAIYQLVRMLMDEEVTPIVPAPPGIDLATYRRTLLQRFRNPTIRDQLARIATDSSARMPKFVLPSIVDQVRRGGPIDALCFTVAAWFHFLGQQDDRGRKLEVVDPMRARLVEAASHPSPGLEPFFALTELFDDTLLQSPRFRNQVKGIVRSFREQGARATLERFLMVRSLQ